MATETTLTESILVKPQQKKTLPPILTESKKSGCLQVSLKNKEADHLPKNLLQTLTQARKKFDDLGPGKKRRSKYTPGKTDNVWNHERSRSKFKHLTEQPPCYCGAGRDISYLLDETKSKDDGNVDAKKQNEEDANNLGNHGKSAIPESIIPSEFHVIKHKGVVGLEMHNDEYSTNPEDHADHLTMFPSMKPSGRQEALQLMQTMNTLLERAGVDSSNAKVEKEEAEGNQIENLLNLVKNEQKIYNIIFNEIIRQVSVECVERGSVLAELRKHYATMLDRVPKQVKSLHEEVLAQRALDRRLTEELSRFKTSITLLTKELHEIHAHDEEVTRQAIETQAELNEALKESEKNASLLAEYHDLYELQRRRLDYQVSKLIEERDLWAGSAHMLSLKVTEKHNMVTVRRLHLFEKAWFKLANRFAVLLGSEDEKQLQNLAVHVHAWQDTTDSFNERLTTVERETFLKMKAIKKTLSEWGKRFDRVVTPDEGTVNPLNTSGIEELFHVLKSWEEIFNAETERLTGEVLLACEDDVLQLDTCVDLWMEAALKIFTNHPVNNDTKHSQHEAMLQLNKKVEELHHELKMRMSGENGLAKAYIKFINSLDTWVNKINVLLHGGETLFDSEWVQLADHLQEQWPDILDRIMSILCPDNEEALHNGAFSPEKRKVRRVNVQAVSETTQKWLNDTIDSFETENANILEQVVTTHSNMIRWMITILIRFAPDTVDENNPAGSPEEDQSSGLGASILTESTSEAIVERATMIFNWLRSLTDLLVSCCKDLVKIVQSDHEENHSRDIAKIETECQGWMSTANILIFDLTGGKIPMDDFQPTHAQMLQKADTVSDSSRVNSISSEAHRGSITSSSDVSDVESENKSTPVVKEQSQSDVESLSGPLPNSSEDAPAVLDSQQQKQESSIEGQAEDNAASVDDEHIEMHVIGHDENVKRKRMMSITEQTRKDSGEGVVEGVAGSSMSLESLNALDEFQKQMISTEQRAQNAEERAFVAESALKEAEERIRALERSLSRTDVS